MTPETYNKQYIDNLNPVLRARLNVIKQRVGENIWAVPLYCHFTDYGLEHSNRLIEILGQLANELPQVKRLNEHEVFILFAAAYLLDIGMQYPNLDIIGLSEKALSELSHNGLDKIREKHNELSYHMIFGSVDEIDKYISLGLERDQYLEPIALISEGHGVILAYLGLITGLSSTMV